MRCLLGSTAAAETLPDSQLAHFVGLYFFGRDQPELAVHCVGQLARLNFVILPLPSGWLLRCLPAAAIVTYHCDNA